MKLPPTAELLDCAVVAARVAGSHALANRHRRREAVKTFHHDVKLALDMECQQIASEIVLSRFPDHVILGEESPEGTTTATAGACEWVIDPIDGTVNFSHGLPIWCCSVAARVDGRSIAGAVYAPELDRLFTATADGDAFVNDERIEVSAVGALEEAIVLTGLDKHPDTRVPPFAIFERLSTECMKTRIIGSAALDLCMVASGNAEGYFETGIYVWDVAAAGLILERAGGKAEVIRNQGGHRLAMVASNGRIHERLKAIVDSILPR